MGPIVGEAMRGNAALRAFSGYMIFFLAFLLRTVHFPGVNDKVALGAMIAAAGAGGFIGTGIGALLKARRPAPDPVRLLGARPPWSPRPARCSSACGRRSSWPWSPRSARSWRSSPSTRSCSGRSREEIRSSTLAASETIHQLAWVAGGLAGLAMSITNSGVAGLAVAAAGLAVTTALLVASGAAGSSPPALPRPPAPP